MRKVEKRNKGIHYINSYFPQLPLSLAIVHGQFLVGVGMQQKRVLRKEEEALQIRLAKTEELLLIANQCL